MYIWKQLTACLIAITALAGCQTAEPAHKIIWSATIQTVGERPDFVSGVIATFVEIRVKDRRGVEMDLAIPYMATDQKLPKVGQTCSIVYLEPEKDMAYPGEIKRTIVSSVLNCR